MNGKRVPQNARFVERKVRRTGMPENAQNRRYLVANGYINTWYDRRKT
jgi:hypothetical protein